MPTLDQLKQQADESGAGNSGEFIPLPDGKYTVIIEEVKTKPFKKSTGDLLTFKMQVVEDPHKGRILFYTNNLYHEKPQTAGIASKDIANILEAVNQTSWDDNGNYSNVYHIPFTVTVGSKMWEGRVSNEVKILNMGDKGGGVVRPRPYVNEGNGQGFYQPPKPRVIEEPLPTEDEEIPF